MEPPGAACRGLEHGLDIMMEGLEDIIGEDPGRRGIASLKRKGELRAAAADLVGSSSVCIATGYPCCMSDPPTETDGPLGALAIARALSCLGKRATILTDECNHAPIAAALAASTKAYPMFPHSHLISLVSLPPGPMANPHAIVAEHGFDHLLAIERPGPASGGGYYTMKGRDMAATVGIAHIEDLWSLGIRSTGIGDGGNELGMGKRLTDIRAGVIPLGSKIGCVVPADNLIACGVSNWGGWALALAACAIGGGAEGTVTVEGEWAVLESLVKAGARDGVTGESECTVDGLPWGEHEGVLRRLRTGAGL